MSGEVTEVGIAYLAGLLDGEGCFTVHRVKGRNGKYYYQPQIKCQMTSQEAIYWVQAFTGTGNIRHLAPRKEGYKPSYEWTVTGPDAAEISQLLAKHLLVKQEQAALLVRLAVHINNKRPVDFAAHDETVWDYREQLWMECKRLNSGGVPDYSYETAA